MTRPSDDEASGQNEIMRASVFFAKPESEPRPFHRAKRPLQITFSGTSRFLFFGEELRQGDQAVWNELVRQARSAGSVWIEFVPQELLSSLQWPDTDQSHTHLKDVLTRLTAAMIEVYDSSVERGFNVTFVNQYKYKYEKGMPWFVKIPSQEEEILSK